MTERKSLNIRPKGSPDAKGYSPDRDLAYVYPAMMREAFVSLDQVNWTPTLEARLAAHNIDEDELGEAVRMFVEGLNLFIRTPDVKEPVDAMRLSGFADDVREEVQQVLYAQFGTVLTGGWFVAVRDVTLQGHLSDAEDLMADMRAAGMRLAGVNSFVAADAQLEKAQGEAFELRRALEQSVSRVRQAVVQEAELQERLMQSLRNNAEMVEKLAALNAQVGSIREAITKWLESPLLARLWKGVGILLAAVMKKQVFNVDCTNSTATSPANPTAVSAAAGLRSDLHRD